MTPSEIIYTSAVIMAPSSVDFTAREVYLLPSMSSQKANAASIVAARPLIVSVTLLKSVTLIDPA